MASPEFCVIVNGTFEQGNPEIFEDHSVGKQCMANSATALAFSLLQDVSTWKTTDSLGCAEKSTTRHNNRRQQDTKSSLRMIVEHRNGTNKIERVCI